MMVVVGVCYETRVAGEVFDMSVGWDCVLYEKMPRVHRLDDRTTNRKHRNR